MSQAGSGNAGSSLVSEDQEGGGERSTVRKRRSGAEVLPEDFTLKCEKIIMNRKKIQHGADQIKHVTGLLSPVGL